MMALAGGVHIEALERVSTKMNRERQIDGPAFVVVQRKARSGNRPGCDRHRLDTVGAQYAYVHLFAIRKAQRKGSAIWSNKVSRVKAITGGNIWRNAIIEQVDGLPAWLHRDGQRSCRLIAINIQHLQPDVRARYSSNQVIAWFHPRLRGFARAGHRSKSIQPFACGSGGQELIGISAG